MTYIARRATSKIWHLYDGEAVFGTISRTSRGAYRWSLVSWMPNALGVYPHEVEASLGSALEAAKRAYNQDKENARKEAEFEASCERAHYNALEYDVEAQADLSCHDEEFPNGYC